MKRLLLDAILTILILMIVSSIADVTNTKEKEIPTKIERFEEQIAQNQPVVQMVKDSTLNPVEENKAGKIAEFGSNMVISILDTGKDFLTTLWKRLF